MARLSAAVLSFVVVACASSGTTDSAESSADYVTGQELRATGATTLQAALEAIRPRWLALGRQSAGVTRSGTIEACRANVFVYVDGRRSHDPLDRVRLTNIEGVRFLRVAGMRPDGDRRCPGLPAVNVVTRSEG